MRVVCGFVTSRGAAARRRVHAPPRATGAVRPASGGPEPPEAGRCERRCARSFWVVTFDLDPATSVSFPIPMGEPFRCCLLRTLYSYNGKPGGGGGVARPRPDLADGMPGVSSDGLTWTFRLRQGLVLRASLRRHTDRLAGSHPSARNERLANSAVRLPIGPIRGCEEYASGAADSIVGLEARDDRTLVVQLEQVTSDLAYRFTSSGTAPIPAGDIGGPRRRLRAIRGGVGTVHGGGCRSDRLLRSAR